MDSRHTPVLPISPAPFAVHLALAEPATSGDPFIRLDGAGGNTRTYLGSLRSAAGAEVAPVVVQLPPRQIDREKAPTLRRIEQQWSRRRDDQRRLAGVAPELFPQQLLPGESNDPGHGLEPLLYCHTRQRLFPILDPRSLRPLHTCRDDKLLVGRSLPPSATGVFPLLVDPEASEDPARFYLAAETVPAELAQQGVMGLAELRTELAATLAEKIRTEPGFDPSRYPATEPSPDADDSASGPPWFVLTEYDSPYLVSRCEPWDFDAFVDYLGGREITTATGPAASSRGKRGSKGGKGKGASSRFQIGSEGAAGGYLFATEGSGLDAVEVLLLKLALFDQVVEAIDHHYRTLGPHLDLHPGHLAVHTPESTGTTLPDRWSFRARLLGLSSARRRTLPQGVEQVAPPAHPRRPYASRALREAALIETRDGEVVIDRLLEEKKDTVSRFVVQGRLRDPNGIFPAPKHGDLLLVHWPHQLFGSADFTTTAQADPEASASDAELVFFTEPVELTSAVVKRLKVAVSTPLRGSRYRLLPRLHVPDDLHALGILLLRLLLVNDHQDLSVVEQVLGDVPDLTVDLGQDMGFSFEQRLESSLANALEEHLERLAPSNIFFREDDRLAGRANAIPQELWQETLRLAWRLVARGPGFGLTPGGRFDEDHPASHLDPLIQEVRSLLRQLRLILFRRQGVHVEVHSMIAEMMADIS